MKLLLSEEFIQNHLPFDGISLLTLIVVAFVKTEVTEQWMVMCGFLRESTLVTSIPSCN